MSVFTLCFHGDDDDGLFNMCLLQQQQNTIKLRSAAVINLAPNI